MLNYFIIFCADYLIYVLSIVSVFYFLLSYKGKLGIKSSFTIILSACLAWTVSHFLKDIISHPRPDATAALVPVDSLYSFPSGHTTYSFGLAYSAYLFNKKIGFYLLIIAAIIGVSRVLAGVHYWYDIVGGIMVGIIVAYIVTNITKKYIR